VPARIFSMSWAWISAPSMCAAIGVAATSVTPMAVAPIIAS
jgi:hypothetical protein